MQFVSDRSISNHVFAVHVGNGEGLLYVFIHRCVAWKPKLWASWATISFCKPILDFLLILNLFGSPHSLSFTQLSFSLPVLLLGSSVPPFLKTTGAVVSLAWLIKTLPHIPYQKWHPLPYICDILSSCQHPLSVRVQYWIWTLIGVHNPWSTRADSPPLDMSSIL